MRKLSILCNRSSEWTADQRSVTFNDSALRHKNLCHDKYPRLDEVQNVHVKRELGYRVLVYWVLNVQLAKSKVVDANPGTHEYYFDFCD